MIRYEKEPSDTLSFFSYINSQYMIKSLLFRKQGKVDLAENSAMITWGPNRMVGGVVSNAISEKLITSLEYSHNPCYIYFPKGEWKHYIGNTFPNQLQAKQIHLYQHEHFIETDCQNESSCIVRITASFFQRNLLNVQAIKDELYSYMSIEDFLQNGFGLALVIDDCIYGYCLSEYSIDNECAINIWIDEKYRRLGYAKMMSMLFLQHTKNSNWKIYWGCTSDNVPSNKVAQSTGFILHAVQDYFEWCKQE